MSPEQLFRKFEIPRESGKRPRTIYDPTPEHKDHLGALHFRLLEFMMDHEPFRELYYHGLVHGFVPDRDSKTHALKHITGRTILHADIYSAFDRTRRDRVIASLEAMDAHPDLVAEVDKNCFVFGFLPTGYPTSPDLFNIAFLHVDMDLAEFARAWGMEYSRYADNLVFSTQHDVFPQEQIDDIRNLVSMYGYDTHKISIGRPWHRPYKICGVSLFQGTARVSRKDRLRMRARVHKLLLGDDPQRLSRTLGLVDYMSYIEGERPNIGKANARMLSQISRKKR